MKPDEAGVIAYIPEHSPQIGNPPYRCRNARYWTGGVEQCEAVTVYPTCKNRVDIEAAYAAAGVPVVPWPEIDIGAIPDKWITCLLGPDDASRRARVAQAIATGELDSNADENAFIAWINGKRVPVSGEHTLGDYPNAANVREWMRLFFGRDAIDTDLRNTLWHSRDELPDISTADDAIRFGLEKRYRLTDAGRAKAYGLGVLSDDSPAVPIPKGATPTGASSTATPTADAGATPTAQRGKRKAKVRGITDIAGKLNIARWQAVTLEVDGDFVRVNGALDYTYSDLGIGRGRLKGEVSRAARLLIIVAAARNAPYVPSDDALYAGTKGLDAFSVHLTRLNTALRKSFGLAGNPVYLNGAGAVETLFAVTAAGADADMGGGDNVRVAPDRAAGRRHKTEYDSLAQAEQAADAIRDKTKNKSRY